MAQRPREVVVEQRLADVAPEAAGARQEPLGVVGQHLPVHLRLVVVTLEEGAAGELDEVAVAGLVLRQQREVVVELGPGGGLAAAVVHLAAPGRTLVTALVGHVGLDPQDRLDAAGPAGLVERHEAVEVPVIGDPERRLAVGSGCGHERIHPRGAVEHGVLGVGVQVNEAVRHRRLPRLSPRDPHLPVDKSQWCRFSADHSRPRTGRALRRPGTAVRWGDAEEVRPPGDLE